MHDSSTDSNIGGVLLDLQASYSNTTIELAVNSQIANSPAVVAAFGLFKQTY